jgi:hypothetical protein
MNLNDQCEIALLRFNTLVQPESVVKFIYTKLNYNKVETILPLIQARDIRIFYDVAGFYSDLYYHDSIIDETKFRMNCSGKDLQIYYKRVGTDTENIFDCSVITQEETYRQKYLKYKTKYIQLKKQFGLN